MSKSNLVSSRKNILKELKDSLIKIKDTHSYIKKLSNEKEEIIGGGQWLLDNIYLIEKEYKVVKLNMPIQYFNNLILEDIDKKVSPRIFNLAMKMVKSHRGKITEIDCINFIKNENEMLTMGELWAFPLMLRASLIINLSKFTDSLKDMQKDKKEGEDLARTLELLDENYNKLNDLKEQIKNKSFIFLQSLNNSIKYNLTQNNEINEIIREEFKHKENGENINFLEASLEEEIGASIISFRQIDSINWRSFFQNTSMVEKILMQDPALAYEKMDFKSKDYYRHKIEKISKKYGINEIDIATKAIDLSRRNNVINCEYKKHVGYYLVDDGIEELGEKLKLNLKNIYSYSKFLSINIFGTLLIDFIVLFIIYLLGESFEIYKYLVAAIILLVPCSEIIVSIINRYVCKHVDIRHVPKMYINDLENNNKTIVIIPTIISSKNDILNLVEKLEIIYLANKLSNVYFAILADFKDSVTENRDEDRILNIFALKNIENLNKKYNFEEECKFFFLNRKRTYNPKENIFMGRERKRGKIVEFINLLKKDKNHTFNLISTSIENLRDARYIITLDTDTFVPRNNIKKLIGAMVHPLNKAIIKNGRVERGYGIIQPKVSISLESANASKFAKIFGGEGGVDGYSIAYSDTYEDLFAEGIFTGKGIIDIDVFYEVVEKNIPNNKVLSHDLLEGCYAKCALVTNSEFIDDYPTTYIGSIKRLKRWVRGDWQLIPWLFNIDISHLSKWKIFDNLRRSIIAPWILFGYGVILYFLDFKIELIFILFLAVMIPLLFNITDFVVTPKNKLIGTIKSFKQVLLIISFIPYQAYTMVCAIIKTLYRVFISKKHMLEWETSDEADKAVKGTLNYYYSKMWFSTVCGIIFMIIAFKGGLAIFLITYALSILWILAPLIAWNISKKIVCDKVDLEENDKKYLRQLSRRIWAYYDDFINEENNYLAPDNYQESPFKGIAYRTSPTNIGMGLISNVVALDLGYIVFEDALFRIEKIISSMLLLETYNGHFLNWYDTKTRKPLYPRYISTVDSGNLLACLLIVKEVLNDYKKNTIFTKKQIFAIKDTYSILGEELNINKVLLNETDFINVLNKELQNIKNKREYFKGEENVYWIERLENEITSKLNCLENPIDIKDIEVRVKKLINNIDEICNKMNFKILYDKDRELFSIGYNLENNSLGGSHYDLLASESRIASFLAISRNEVDYSHWFKLGRAMTNAFRGKSLVSWSGTMFEYFMPNLIMKNYSGTLLDLTYKSVIKAQIAFGKKKRVPWGISESAFYEFDASENYQYRAFGVPGIGLKRGLENELVVSPYSSIMTLTMAPTESIKNLRLLEKYGALGKYGFIEAIDFTSNRINKILDDNIISKSNKDGITNIKRKGRNVRCYMVHHLGMSLLALDNVLNDNHIQKIFHSIPAIKATEVILKEKIPSFITFERNLEQIEDKKNINIKELVPRVYKNILRKNPEVLLLSNGTFSTMLTLTGSGYSKKNEELLYRWKGDNTLDNSGFFIYIRDLKDNSYWSATYEPCRKNKENYDVSFSVDKALFNSKYKDVETSMEVVVAPEDDLDIRKVTLKNVGEIDKTLEITSYMEVVLTTFDADTAHPGFSNLFIETEYDKEHKVLIGKRKPRTKNDKVSYIFHKLIGSDLFDVSYETARLNFIGRNKDLDCPSVFESNKSLSNTLGTVLDPILSIRTNISLLKDVKKQVYFITGVASSKEDVIKLVKEYSEVSRLESSFNMYNKSMQIELKSFNISSEQANIYQVLASYMLFLNYNMKSYEKYIKNINKFQKDLWAYGISGDLKIAMVDIQNNEEMNLAIAMIKMHKYWRSKGLKTDLIIYNNEKISYDQPLQKEILNSINNLYLEDVINKQGGVFLYNKSTMGEDIHDFLLAIASFYINKERETILTQITSDDIVEDMKYDFPENINDLNENMTEEKIYDITSELDFFNGYGGFDKKDSSYVIYLDNNKNTPAPWINVIANNNFGFNVSESGSSHTWCENSRENKITPWSNDYIKDTLGEALYIRDDESGKYFSISPEPVRDNGEYLIRHGFGYSIFNHKALEIKSEMTLFCPKDEKVKIEKIVLENTSNRDREISVFFYAQLVLGVLNFNTKKYITTYKKDNYIFGENRYSEYFGKLKAYATILGGDSLNFTCDRSDFLGFDKGLKAPKALREKNLKGVFGSVLDSCLVIQSKIKLNAGERKELVVLLGEEDVLEDIENKINKYSNMNNVDEALEDIKAYWKKFLGAIQVKTSNKSMDYLLNGWLLYQNYSCRYMARTAFYQSGGAYGFRDQLQDSMSIGLIKPNIIKEQILKSASRQYIEGDVQHWWHPIINSGIRTRFSDDLLWLPYVTAEYINFTGDYTILNEVSPYLEDEPLKSGEDERYTVVNQSSKMGSIYEHCIKAIEKSLKFGIHNIPLMGSGDWNDGMSTVGNEGKGESVWLGWFIYDILSRFDDICTYMNDVEHKEKYLKMKEFIREHLEKNAWDGSWYRRAYFDDGTPLGSKENIDCKIDSLAQSWSVISHAGDLERAKKAMSFVEKYLIDDNLNIIKLLSPPFEKSKKEEPGYIKGYVAGVRENGGQYTHAATWVVLAFAKLGMGEKALKYFNMINPINHTKNKDDCEKYKLEPYVMAADVYMREPHGGRGGWSWYTGTAGWMYKVGLEWLLGFKTYKNEGYKINPLVLDSLGDFELEINNEKENYKIKVVKFDENKILINGEEIKGDLIPGNLGVANIEVYRKV